MALEWGPATRAAAAKQAAAIREAATKREHHYLAERAAKGEFTDYSSDHDCGMTVLHALCCSYGLIGIAQRVVDGEFDATKEESDEWANSPDGKAVLGMLSPAMRKALEGKG